MKRSLPISIILCSLVFLPSCHSLPDTSASIPSSEGDSFSEPASESVVDSENLGSQDVNGTMVDTTGKTIPSASHSCKSNLNGVVFSDTSSQVDNSGVATGDVYEKKISYHSDGVICKVNEQLTNSSGVTFSQTKESVFQSGSEYYSVKETMDQKNVRLVDSTVYDKKVADLYNNTEYLYQGQLNSVYTLKGYKDDKFQGFYFQNEYCYAVKQNFEFNNTLFHYHFEGVNDSGGKMVFELMFAFAQYQQTNYLSYYYASESFTGDQWISDERMSETSYFYGPRESGEYPSVNDEPTTTE